MPWLPGTRVGARSAVTVGANEPICFFSLGAIDAGDCDAPDSGAVVSEVFAESLPQAVMVPIATIAPAPASRATFSPHRDVMAAHSPISVSFRP